jgi:hypothetical protein
MFKKWEIQNDLKFTGIEPILHEFESQRFTLFEFKTHWPEFHSHNHTQHSGPF